MSLRALRRSLFALTLASLAACAGPAPEPVPPPGLGDLLTGAKLVDLTHAFDQNTLYWPTSPSSFELHQLAYGPTEKGYFYAANSFSAPEHGGTHLDAPIHFAEGRWTSDEIPLDKLIGPGVVIDVSAKTATNPDYRLGRDDVAAWESAHGAIPAGAIVLLHTGWGPRWPERKSYFGDDTPGDATKLSFPSYGEEAATYLVEEKRVAALGVDTASIDYGRSENFIVHQIANTANVLGLENVANLDQLPAQGAWIFALPMKIRGGSGGPARIVAIIPAHTP